MSDKVQFQTNVPVEVALKYGDGKEVNGQYGDQVLYTLSDGRVMYVPPIVKRKIEELRIGRGELFTLTKAEKKNGTRRMIEWVVAAGEREDLRRSPEVTHLYFEELTHMLPAGWAEGGRMGAFWRRLWRMADA